MPSRKSLFIITKEQCYAHLSPLGYTAMRVFPLVMPISGITTILQCCATVQSHNLQLRRRLFMPSKLEFHIDINSTSQKVRKK